jgi:ABC-type sugar transport system permease subunit
VLPALAIVATFVLWPILYSLHLSLLSWDFIRPRPTFVGLENYQRLIADPELRRALVTTLLFAAGSVPLSIGLGLGLAFLLHQLPGGGTFYRTALYAPTVASTVAVSLVWSWIYHPQIGVLNGLLGRIGLPPLGWLSDPRTALLSLILMSGWKGLGYNMILFLAGLQAIPREVLDAAETDGAGVWSILRHVTLPLLAPVTLFVLVINTADALQTFTTVHVMTGGGPAGATEVLVFSLWRTAFQFFQMGYASAIAWLVFAMLLVLAAAQFRIFRRLTDWTDAVAGQ